MSDLISRTKAIKWIKTECNPYGKPTLKYKTSCRIMEYLERMPSAEPKHGRWIKSKKSDYNWECSNCGYGLTDYRTTYCYDCGAKMDSDEGEE